MPFPTLVEMGSFWLGELVAGDALEGVGWAGEKTCRLGDLAHCKEKQVCRRHASGKRELLSE